MATSGTDNFLMTRDSIIQAAVRKTGAVSENDTIPVTTMTNCAIALNILCKSLVKRGLFLWCVQEITVPMVPGQTAYPIGPLSSNFRPLRVLDAFLRSNSTNDVGLQITSRYDYDTLGQKSAAGIPNQLYYDPQLSNGIVTLYNVPNDATQVLHLVIQRQIQDFNLATDNPDFPAEAYQLLVWALASEISLDFGCSGETTDRLERRAERYIAEFADYQQEQASVFFTPSERSF